ncbi:MAG TPA: VOC family protein [Acidimicrobiales bacterium]|nr:VOC family protein [Acidimicrobiales bacterium]
MEIAAPVRRVNHVVLKVRDLDRSVAFYCGYFGFTEAFARYGRAMAFLRAPGSNNNHDLALLQAEADAPARPDGALGLFHFALEVDSPEHLAEVRQRFAADGILDREFDHGATKSVYGWDPDGNNVEVLWMLPRERWGEWADRTPDRMPLDLDAEIRAAADDRR